jgi:hypothetical protein
MGPTPRTLPDLVDVPALAAHCGVSTTTARRWFRKALFPRRKLGRKWFAARGAILVSLCEDAEFRQAAEGGRLRVLKGGS